MEIKSIDQLSLENKRVLIRVDFNVPIDEKGQVIDDTRIKASLPTIQYALDHGAKIILASHLGRPSGKVEAKYSLAPVAQALSKLIKKEIKMAPDCIGPEVEKMVAALNPGEIVLLENLRFHPEEEKNDQVFAQKLAHLADIYINDAFAVSHRAHASVEAITNFLAEKAAGFLMKEELHYLDKVMSNPARPLVAIIGGAKVSGKLEVLQNLILLVDKMLIGGGMAFTFLKALGLEVGKSLVEDNLLTTAKEVLKSAQQRGAKVYLPVDCVVAQEISPAVTRQIVPVKEIPPHLMGLDIGPATITLFQEALQGAKTILWNGPLGAFEVEPFSKGTSAIIKAIVDSGALSVAGGGDTNSALNQSGYAHKFSYVSTAGGAFLELLEGKKLPGVEALKNQRKRGSS